MPHTPPLTQRTPHLVLPSKAFPETNSAAIISALKNLQEKIRRMERGSEDLHVNPFNQAADTNTLSQRAQARGRADHPNCNQALINQLSAAESRCVQLERQLENMRRMVRQAKDNKTSVLKQQVSVETGRLADQAEQTSVSEHAQLVKLDRLEQEYLRLTRTQSHAERKISQLEKRLQEEERQRKLVQEQANQLQTGMETNRILLRSVSPRPPRSRTKERKTSSKKPLLAEPAYTQPHYLLHLGDVPFVTGTSVGGSHSVRANVQSVLSLLKQHQPELCNRRVLSHTPLAQNTANHSSSDTCSSSSSIGGAELADLLQALQEELRQMSLEQDELMRRVESCERQRDRKDLFQAQEALLLKMERKGDQISKLYKHKTQSFTTTRGSSPAAAVRSGPGERSRNSLQLLRDMRALQTSLRT
ncbi:centrosomal protein of 57 kDa [Aplochiton taeniatus]